MEFLCSFLRQHFAGKPMVALQNIVCFLRLQFTLPTIPGKGWCSSSFSRCTLSLGSAWSIRRFWSVHWKDTFTLKLQCNIYMNTSFSRPKKVDCKFIDMCDSKLSCQTLTSSEVNWDLSKIQPKSWSLVITFLSHCWLSCLHNRVIMQ